MKYALYFIVSLLIAATVCQCSGIRSQATRIKTARTRRLDEAEGN